MDEIRFADLFSGIGGFTLGLERANSSVGAKLTAREGGHQDKEGLSTDFGGKDGNGREKHTDGNYRCVWSCDNDKYANQVYTKQFGGEGHYSGDIEGVDPEEIPDFDLLCAGFPCQAFSVAGKRKGFQDTRGTLFFEICRIAEAKRPSLLLLENVKGLLSHDGGRTFTVILQSLDEMGYWVEWQVLNSKHFVPQNRERVFIIGHLRGTGGREVFPIGETDISAYEATEVEDGDPASTVTAGYGKQNMRGSYLRSMPVSTAIDSNYWKGVDKHGQRTMVLRWQNKQQGVVVDDKAPALRASGGTDIRKKPAIIGNIYPSGGEAGQIHDPRGIFSTVKQGKRGGKAGVPPIYDGVRIRRLTPVECERLQGFPDGWTSHGICEKGDIVWTGKYRTRVEIDEDGLEVVRYHPIMTKAAERGVYPLCDTPRYKCLGNAVTVNVIDFLGRRIRNIKSDNVR